VLNRLIDDPDRAVRTQAVATLGRILTDAGIVDLVARLPALGATSARLVAKALELRTGRDHGTDAAAWRRYVADELVAAPGERGFRAAADARRRLGDDPAVHAAVIQRIRKGDGASPEALIGLLKDDDPGVRKAAAAALVDRGRPRDVFPLLDRIWLEEDPDVAATLARGALALDPHQARVTLGRVAKTAQSEIARAAAAAALR
jgi:HEAT repeat protein